jgi:hypothetical protein
MANKTQNDKLFETYFPPKKPVTKEEAEAFKKDLEKNLQNIYGIPDEEETTDQNK